jgi:uncharacterized protein YraI
MKAKILGTALGVGIMIGSLTGVAQVSAAPGTAATFGAASSIACDCETRYTTTDLNLRSGPGTNHDVMLVIPAGAAVRVYLNAELSQNGFIKTAYNENYGWASTQYLTASGGGGNGGGGGVDGGSEADITGTAFTSASANFRQGPGTNYGVNYVIEEGAQLATTDKVVDGFRYIWHAGNEGWIYDALLTQESPGYATEDVGAYSKIGTGVTNAAVNFRSGPSTSHDIQWLLSSGTAVEMTTATQNGFRLVFVNGTAGWVYESFITPPASLPNQGATGLAKTTAAVNFRSGPSTGHSVINVLPAGSVVKTTDTVENGFRQVTYNGTTGWIHTDYLG